MTPTKDQQAQEYAEKKNKALRKAWHKYRYGPIREDDDWENDPVKPSGNFEKGFNAGVSFCEQSMWRSVEEEEPPIGKLILCRDTDRVALAYFDGEAITEAVFPNEDVTMPFWMPIPSLPDTNTEKI